MAHFGRYLIRIHQTLLRLEKKVDRLEQKQERQALLGNGGGGGGGVSLEMESYVETILPAKCEEDLREIDTKASSDSGIRDAVVMQMLSVIVIVI